ncbi:MAG: ABC transporter permease [Candidatus Cloacimonetes bacterium]|nr:ABC transporter permease [Candidatus Cloacimonadota bacterium]
MNTTLTIFRKEMIEMLRDKRTLISMLIPIIMFPLLIGIVSKVISSKRQESEAKILEIALIQPAGAMIPEAYSPDDITWRYDLSAEVADSMIVAEELDALVIIPDDFLVGFDQLDTATIQFHYKRLDDTNATWGRVMSVIDEFENELMRRRFTLLELPETAADPFEVCTTNLATIKERMGLVIGGLLPYMFIIFALMGCMHPAIDLVAGEKERGTFETLLSSPAGKLQILTGKFMVVVLVALTAVGISLLGLIIAMTQIKEIPQELKDAVAMVLEPGTVLMVLSLIIPLVVFFAAVLLALSVGAKSYKEAQSMMGPLMPVVIVPAYIGLLPGVELSMTTAMIPIINVTLACKAIMSGNIDLLPVTLVYVSMIAYALLGLFICARLFRKDESLLKGL